MITRLGFKVDDGQLNKAKKRIQGFKKFTKFAIAGAVTGLAALGIGAIKAASDMEMLTTQFEVMLGSTDKANAMMKELKTFAATTPFQLNDLAKGSQQLLAFGVAEKDVIDRMRMLGDTAGGSREKLAGLVLAFGKVQTKGKASMEEINMIAEKGVPIIGTLRKQLGVTEQQFFKMVSAGKIGRKEITQAFKTMTSEGGIFFKGMEKQSLTFSGLISTLKDVLQLALAELGTVLLPIIKDVAKLLIDLVQGPLGDLLRSLGDVLVPIFEVLGKILPKLIKFLIPILEMVGNILGKLLVGLLPVFDLLEPILEILLELTPLLEVIVELVVLLIPPIVFILKILLKLLTVVLKPWIKIIVRLIKEVKNLFSLIGRGIMRLVALFEKIVGPIKNVLSKIGDFFRDMWNGIAKSVNKAIDAFNKLVPKRFDIAARLPILDDEDKLLKKEIAGKGGKMDITQENKIDITAPQGRPGETGMTPSAMAKVANSVFRRNFNVELKKIMQGAIG